MLKITADGRSTTFSGQGATTYINPKEQWSLTAEQGQVAVAYTVTDTASISFDYSAFGSDRTMYIDVGNLTFSTPTSTYVVGAIPESASTSLLFGASIVLLLISRRKSV